MRKDAGAEPITYTYGQMGEAAWQGAGVLRQLGVAPGERVILMSENRPEWGIAYFAILLAGAHGGAARQGADAWPRSSTSPRCRARRRSVLSRKVAERLAGEADIAVPLGDGERSTSIDASCWSPAHPALGAWLDPAGRRPTSACSRSTSCWPSPTSRSAPCGPTSRATSLASLIFTSGTTGTPKGVMLTHKNLTSLVSKLSSLFTLYKHDKLLSVLPLHHTFEFSAGFLMPLMRGASIDYLEELEADALARALEDEGVTGMVGVPALWQLLERKIYKNVSDARRAGREGVRLDRRAQPLAARQAAVGRRRRQAAVLPGAPQARRPDAPADLRRLGAAGRHAEGVPRARLQPVRGLRPDRGRAGAHRDAARRQARLPGSVGRPLPGIDVRIDQPDASGVGEVIARART